MAQRQSRRQGCLLRWALAGVVVLLLTVGMSALVNLRFPRHSTLVDYLSEVEKARLAEASHVRQELGDAAWPGFGQADIPLIVYNEEYAFLLAYPNPAPGWMKMPQREEHGGAWEVVPNDDFLGQPYYRQRLPDPDITPEAFTVLVGDRWVASLGTREWMHISLANQVRGELPFFLKPIFPYGLAVNLLLGSSDAYIAALTHESFHAYQGALVSERLAEAERATRLEAGYPWDDAAHIDEWRDELDLLAEAMRTESNAEATTLAAQFLAQRQHRRQEAGLSSDLVDYERQREWLEGLAKYMELELWKQAAETSGYEPVQALANDPEFDYYVGYNGRWSQEVSQIHRMADDHGDGRFYYSGLAQAVLLDRLVPGWKARVLNEGVFLEALLQQAIEQAGHNSRLIGG